MFALIGLCFALPILCLCVPCLVAVDGFPVLFRQKRIGLHGVPFTIYKLRSMKIDADNEQAEDGNRIEMGQKGQGRVTRFGRFLRNTKIDELPQFWNVLRGDLALVGPRAHIPVHVHALNDAYQEQWQIVHSVKPGLTDPATIRYIDEEAELLRQVDPEIYYWQHLLPHKLAMYQYYIQRKSILVDLGILVRTAWAIFRHWLQHFSYDKKSGSQASK